MNGELKTKILQNVKKDYESSKVAKVKVDNVISGWIRAYNGDAYGNEVKGRSSIVIKDVKKAVKKLAPSIIQPFIASDMLIKTKPKTLGSIATSSMASDVLNYQYNNEFDKLHFARTIASVLPKEGTVIVRTGWEYDETSDVESYKGLNVQQLQMLQEQGAELEEAVQEEDGTFSVKVKMTDVLYNRPTAIICKGESIYTDPTAEKFDDSKFVIHEFEKTLSDLLKMSNIYDVEKQMGSIERFLDSNNNYADTSLGAKRVQDSLYNGVDQTFKFSQKANKKLKICEYWGEYDIDGDDIAENVVVAWIKNSDIVLRCEENPYPDKEKPFVSEAYDLEPFTIWGNGVADFIDDNQRIHTAIMRGFIDNLSLSNNGQKFFQKGTVDYINMQKMLNGEKIIELNNIDGFKDGSYNQIPSASFQVYAMQDDEIEHLTGLSKHLDGIDDATIGRTASGVNQTMTAAQRHLVITVQIVANLYKKIFQKWHKYNQVFLDEGQLIEIAGQLVEMAKQDIAGEHTVEVNVNVDSLNQQKVQQINMLLQQSQTLQGQIPPQIFPMLVAEIFSTFGKEEVAEMIRTYQPQPDPFAEQMKQLEMMKLQAEIELMRAEAMAMTAKSDNTSAQAELQRAKTSSMDMNTLGTSEKIRRDRENEDIDRANKQADIDKKYNDTVISAYQKKDMNAKTK